MFFQTKAPANKMKQTKVVKGGGKKTAQPAKQEPKKLIFQNDYISSINFNQN